VLGNRHNSRVEFLFDTIQVESIFVGDEVDGNSQVAISSRSSNTMQVGLRVLGEVEVDDNVDRLNIDSSGEQI